METRFALIATDLDGTLLRGDGSISERTRRALAEARARGVRVVSVTARPPRRVRAIAAAVGLSGVAICSNGAVVYDIERDAIVQQRRLQASSASEIVLALRAALPGVRFAAEIGPDYGCEVEYPVPPEHAYDASDPAMLRTDALLLCRAGVTKLIVQHARASLPELLQHAIVCAGPYATVTHSGAAFVELAAAGITKARALELFCTELDIPSTAVIAFGDMPNDLPMLTWAGHAVAVANAHPDVQRAADEITCSNDEDGVARVIERVLSQAGSASR